MSEQIRELLLTLGIHSTHRGFHFLLYALLLCLQDEDYLLFIGKKLSSIRIPTRAAFAGDIIQKGTPNVVANLMYLGFRHNTSIADSSRDPNTQNYPSDMNATANFVYLDGHQGNITYPRARNIGTWMDQPSDLNMNFFFQGIQFH